MPQRECQPRLILAYRDPAFWAKGRKEMTVSRLWEIEQKWVGCDESNSWRDIICDSESELKGVMEPLLGIPALP